MPEFTNEFVFHARVGRSQAACRNSVIQKRSRARSAVRRESRRSPPERLIESAAESRAKECSCFQQRRCAARQPKTDGAEFMQAGAGRDSIVAFQCSLGERLEMKGLWDS